MRDAPPARLLSLSFAATQTRVASLRRAVLFPPCTMLEVKKASVEELEKHEAATPSQSPKKMSELVELATSVPVLHDVIERQASQRQSDAETRRFRVLPDCDERGKRFVSIDVLPHFL